MSDCYKPEMYQNTIKISANYGFAEPHIFLDRNPSEIKTTLKNWYIIKDKRFYKSTIKPAKHYLKDSYDNLYHLVYDSHQKSIALFIKFSNFEYQEDYNLQELSELAKAAKCLPSKYILRSKKRITKACFSSQKGFCESPSTHQTLENL